MAEFMLDTIGLATTLYDLAGGDRVTRQPWVPSCAHGALGETGNIVLIIFRDTVTPVIV